jgi:hypothetical protein
MRKDGDLKGGQQEVLGPEFLASMKDELEDLARILTPSEPLKEIGTKQATPDEAEEGPEPEAESPGADEPADVTDDGAKADESANGMGGEENAAEPDAFRGDLFDSASEDASERPE